MTRHASAPIKPYEPAGRTPDPRAAGEESDLQVILPSRRYEEDILVFVLDSLGRHDRTRYNRIVGLELAAVSGQSDATDCAPRPQTGSPRASDRRHSLPATFADRW